MKILKGIKINQPVTKETQMISTLVYLRDLYEGYDYQNGDVFDNAILEAASQFAKYDAEGNRQAFFSINIECEDAMKHLREHFDLRHAHPYNVQITQTGLNDLTMVELDRLRKRDFSSKVVNIHWFNTKQIGDSDLEVLPKNCSISLKMYEFDLLAKTISAVDFNPQTD